MNQSFTADNYWSVRNPNHTLTLYYSASFNSLNLLMVNSHGS